MALCSRPFSLRMTTLLAVLLVILCCGVLFGAAETLTEGFGEKEKACFADSTSQECSSDPSSHAPTFKDIHHAITLVQDVISIASSGDIAATDTAANLQRIKTNLETGQVRAGVVGLTKSGKSTFLNALLGKRFLPSSIQPQTAKEVSIMHDPSTDGELYAVKLESNDLESVAVGRGPINTLLAELNTEARRDKRTFQKLILHVPILFLEGVENVQLEISDTPGLYEAAAKNITSESELAVKEMCAFVMILNVQLLKTESEAEVIKALIRHHPELLSKLSRIVILVNAYDMTFYDDSPGNLKPDQIPSYVSDYLQKPAVIGITIPPQQIIPFSAKWALNARTWSANPSSFFELPNARLLYDEAVILMQRANFKEDLKSFEQATAEDIEAMSEYLLEFSHIKTIEARLKEMLHENGPEVLLEAAVDDTLAEIKGMMTLIQTNIDLQDVENKRLTLSNHESLSAVFKDFKTRHTSGLQPPVVSVAEINSITESLRGTLNSRISTIFQTHLTGFHGHNDRNAVYNRICSVKPLLTNPANTEIQTSWSSISRIVHQKNLERAKSAISEMKTELVAAFTTFAKDHPTVAQLALKLSGELSAVIDHIDSNTLVPSFPALPLTVQVDGNTIANDRLNQLLTSYVTQWKTTEFRKKKKKKWGKSKRKRYYQSTSYQSAVFSPAISSLQNIFSADATNPWVQSFRTSIDNGIATTSNQLVQTVVQAKEKALFTAEGALAQAVETSRNMLKSSRDKVDRLTTSKTTLLKLQEDLKALYN